MKSYSFIIREAVKKSYFLKMAVPLRPYMTVGTCFFVLKFFALPNFWTKRAVFLTNIVTKFFFLNLLNGKHFIPPLPAS